MVKDRFERLNKLLIVIDSFDDPEDPDILADVAISVDDMEDFLSDVEKLTVEKYGGATFEELNDEDDNDSAAGRAIALSREEAASHVVREAEEITKKALGKRGIASESLMDDAFECGIASLAVEYRTAGLDAEDIEKAPEDFVSMLSLSQLLGCMSWHFKRETRGPRLDRRIDRLGRHVPLRRQLPGGLGQEYGVAGAPTCPCRIFRGRGCPLGRSTSRQGSRRRRAGASPSRASPAPPRQSA